MDFNVIFIIPTGINCEIGGHAGDATKYLNLIAPMCDNVITHPNVVNASDINEMPSNAMYVNGYILDEFMKGCKAFFKVRKPRILALVEYGNPPFVTTAVNTVNAARTILGADIQYAVFDPIIMKGSVNGGIAEGKLGDLKNIKDRINKYNKVFDAIAISSFIDVDKDLMYRYNRSSGDIPNPLGKVEAMLTNDISYEYNVVSAHAPMDTGEDYYESDPRMAAEMISMGFFFSVLKGLTKAPVMDPTHRGEGLSMNNIDAIVIPYGVYSEVLESVSRRYPVKVITVKNKHSLKHKYLPNTIDCNNYYEAVGVLSAIKQGIKV